VSHPRACSGCNVRPIAYYGRKFCFDCVPRARKSVLRCKLCGSDIDYYTAGRCRRCHRSSPDIGSCLDCLGWGVTRRGRWLCESCRGWRRRFPIPASCPSCQRVVTVNTRGYCRLCCKQASLVRPDHQSLELLAANRNGQQLFLAGPFRQPHATAALASTSSASWPLRYPVDHEQLVLFAGNRDLPTGHARGFAAPPLPDLATALNRVVYDHASRHGWKLGTRNATLHSLQILLALQDTPGARIRHSEVTLLYQLPSTAVQASVEVLTSVGMFTDDREAPLESWFARHTSGISEPMLTELHTWFVVVRDGSSTPPRSQPRSIRTVRGGVVSVTPALMSWSLAGHSSLREITREDITNVLPDDAERRRNTISSLRSLFRLLKGRGVVFVNPAARLSPGPVRSNLPLPVNTAVLREALNSRNPARAALTALLAFHGPRLQHVQTLQLTDIRDGRLFLDGRTILLAPPVRERLRAWLEERTRRWPDTLNPHLFINKHTALRASPVSMVWIRETLGMPGKDIRDDRILHEAIATQGDVRRLGDLFGISVNTALRYTHSLGQPTTPGPTTGSGT
jgi:hypothetical protein